MRSLNPSIVIIVYHVAYSVAALLLGRLCLCPDDVMEALGTIGEEVFAKEIYMPSEALVSGSAAPNP